MKKTYKILALLVGLFYMALPADATRFTGKHSPYRNYVSADNINVSRDISVAKANTDGKPYVVVILTINKGKIGGKGKLEETISPDFEASEVYSSDATFSFKKGKVIFTWKNMPNNDVVTVSYELSALTTVPDAQSVSGEFEFDKQTIPVYPTLFSMKVAKPDTAKKPPAPVVSKPVPTQLSKDTIKPAQVKMETQVAPEIAKHDSDVSAPVINKPDTIKEKMASPVKEETTAPAKEKIAPPFKAPTSAANTETTQPVNQLPVTNQPVFAPSKTSQVIPDLFYKIQIGAFSDKSKLHKILIKYNITEQPDEEVVDDATTRYLIGNYPNINAAHGRIDELKQNGMTGIFAVPYYKGKRITMQQANQLSKHNDSGGGGL